jgi:hypothetical protein
LCVFVAHFSYRQNFSKERHSQLNIVNDINFSKGLQLIIKEKWATNFTLVKNTVDFEYKNTKKLY